MVIVDRKRNSSAKRKLKKCPTCQTFSYRHDHHVKTAKHRENLALQKGQVEVPEATVSPSEVVGPLVEAPGEAVGPPVESLKGPAVTPEADISPVHYLSVEARKHKGKDSMLHDFSTYLQSFMGGAIRKDLSDKHRSNASQVWDVFNPITDSPNALVESIEQQVKTDVWKPNTARTYLNSFKMLLTFLGSMSLIGDLLLCWTL